MYYSIYKIQNKIANIPNFKDKKVEIIQFFNNIIDNSGIESIYTHDEYPPYFLSQKDTAQLFEQLTSKFQLDFKISDFYEGSKPLLMLPEDLKYNKHDIKTQKDANAVVSQHFESSIFGKHEQEKELQKTEHKKKKVEVLQAEIDARKLIEKQKFDRSSNLLRDFVYDKVVSIDFEFFINKKEQTYEPTELGISFTENGDIKSYHFLIQENYKKKKNRDLQAQFNFGKTEIISEKQIPTIINHAINDAQYVLFHEQREDTQILNNIGIHIPESIPIVDTQLSYKRYFRTKDSLPNGQALEDLLSMFKINYKNLHNAGNDAHMTLVLLQKMSETQQNIYAQNKKNRPKSNLKNCG